MSAATALETAQPGYAARRVDRLLALSLAIADIALLLANAPAAVTQAQVVSGGLTASVLLLVLACAAAALAVFASGTQRSSRWIWRVQATGMLLALLALPIVLGHRVLPTSVGLTWISELEILAGCAAVLAWSPRVAVGYAIALNTLAVTIALLWGSHGALGRAFGDATRQLFFVSLFMALAVALVRAGRLLDATVESAILEASAAATATARRAARRRVELLVHDSVIVAMLAYTSGASRRRAAIEAKAALEAIRSSSHDAVNDRALTPRDLAWELQGVTTELDPDAVFDYEATGTQPLPADVCEALIEATSEALRNSVRHASPDSTVARQLDVRITSDSATIVVLDSGSGFDVTTIDATRIGVREGIIGRLRGIDGGRAEVISRPGVGTTVALQWKRR